MPAFLDYRNWFDYRFKLEHVDSTVQESLGSEDMVRGSVGAQTPHNYLLLMARAALLFDRCENRGVVLIYTEGQANRAVVALLRLLADAAPSAQFQHQGDLDLPGIRILASLCERSALPIKPAYMDAETHRRFAASGIQLTDAEYEEALREIAAARLPCRDLLEQIAAARLRIEQESITAVQANCQ